MKTQKGITLMSLVIYIVAMVVIVGVVGTITSFFYSNTADMNESATNLGEFNKFNVAFLNEVKKQGNSVLKLENNDTRIVFTSGTSFTFQDGGIYQDKIKIATGVTNCKFATRMQEEKQIVSVLIEIGRNVPFVKTIEYVMSYETVFNTATIEQDYTSENGRSLPKGWDSSKVVDVVTEKIGGKNYSRYAPIPVGFVASEIPTEDTISEGLVIYQGREAVTGEANSVEHTTAMATRNQFVWIPVDDINYMVMCKNNSSTSVCNLILQADGTLKCKVHNSTDLCGRSYYTTYSSTNVNGNTIYTYSQTFNEGEWTKQTYTENTGVREPDLVRTYDTDSNTSYLAEAGVSTATELLLQLTNDFTDMAESVAKYGGFYVSRYEAGENGASLKKQKVLVSGTYASGDNGIPINDSNTINASNMWYGMYNTIRNEAEIDTTAVKSHMIWGSQYDMIIKYLGENSINEPQVGHATRQLATQKLTGETLTDIMSNIYDLEGNNFEWTAQATYDSSRVARGGMFNSAYR